MAILGGLSTVRYEADSGDLHNARVGETTLSLAQGGTLQQQLTTPATTAEWVRANKNANEWGLEMREVGYCYEAATVPADRTAGRTYKANVLTTAVFNAITIGSTIQIDSIDVTVVSKKREERTPQS